METVTVREGPKMRARLATPEPCVRIGWRVGGSHGRPQATSRGRGDPSAVQVSGHTERHGTNDRVHPQRRGADQLPVAVADQTGALDGDLTGPQLLDTTVFGEPPEYMSGSSRST